jgi:hypothetical protein
MGERARRGGGRRAPEDADRRGWEAAAREGLGIGLEHRWGVGVKWRPPQPRRAPNPSLAAHRMAGFSPAERMEPAQ